MQKVLNPSLLKNKVIIAALFVLIFLQIIYLASILFSLSFGQDSRSENQIFLPIVVEEGGSVPQKLFSEATVAEDVIQRINGRHADLGVYEETKRIRYATINPAVFDGPAGVAQTIELNLFDNRVVLATLDRVEELNGGGLAWIGRIRNVRFSEVTIVYRNGRLTGNIRAPGGLVEIRPQIDAVHSVADIDLKIFVHEGDDTEPVPEEEKQNDTNRSAGRAPVIDGNIIVDVLTVYTADVRDAAGGTVAMNDLIDLAFVESNNAYVNSGVNMRIRNVGTVETSYASS